MPTWNDIRETPNLRKMSDVRETTSYAIQSQYSASPRILALAAQFQRHLEATADIDLFYEKFVNIHTAKGPGLDNWGIILGIGRVVDDPDTGEGLTLNDEYYRLLLLYKALANISPTDADSQNKLLKALLDTGIGNFNPVGYVLETDVMAIRWVFEFYLDPVQLAVFKTAGTLARGAGVGWELYAVNPGQVFGFAGSGMLPFNRAPFAPDKALVVNG